MRLLRDRRRPAIACVVLLLVGLAVGWGCDDDNSLAPFQPEAMNASDNSQLQATGVRNVTNTLTYTWQNSGTSPSMNQATVVSAGSASLLLKDAAGVQVCSRSLAGNGTFATSAGQSGAWTIQLVLNAFSGTLNFRAQKL